MTRLASGARREQGPVCTPGASTRRPSARDGRRSSSSSSTQSPPRLSRTSALPSSTTISVSSMLSKTLSPPASPSSMPSHGRASNLRQDQDYASGGSTRHPTAWDGRRSSSSRSKPAPSGAVRSRPSLSSTPKESALSSSSLLPSTLSKSSPHHHRPDWVQIPSSMSNRARQLDTRGGGRSSPSVTSSSLTSSSSSSSSSTATSPRTLTSNPTHSPSRTSQHNPWEGKRPSSAPASSSSSSLPSTPSSTPSSSSSSLRSQSPPTPPTPEPPPLPSVPPPPPSSASKPTVPTSPPPPLTASPSSSTPAHRQTTGLMRVRGYASVDCKHHDIRGGKSRYIRHGETISGDVNSLLKLRLIRLAGNSKESPDLLWEVEREVNRLLKHMTRSGRQYILFGPEDCSYSFPGAELQSMGWTTAVG